MTPLRFAVVGCGAIATSSHIPALRRSGSGALVAVVDRDAAWARTVARKFGARHALSEVDALRGVVDAAIVATPNTTHAAVADTLVEQGIHVLCEKPVCTTPSDAQRLLARAPMGARVMPAHVRRFQDNLARARQLLADGVIGEPLRLTVSQSSRKGAWASRTAYRDDPTLAGGGVLIELGVHLIDVALWFLGCRLTGVDAMLISRLPGALESDAHLALRFASGAVAEVAASDRVDLPRSLVLRGADGWLSTGLDEDQPVVFFNRHSRACRIDGAQRVRPRAVDPFQRQIVEFTACVRSGAAFPVPNADVVLGLEIIAKAYADRRKAA